MTLLVGGHETFEFPMDEHREYEFEEVRAFISAGGCHLEFPDVESFVRAAGRMLTARAEGLNSCDISDCISRCWKD